jgi:hypothetical protein
MKVYHGTSRMELSSILNNGFRKGTFFATSFTHASVYANERTVTRVPPENRTLKKPIVISVDIPKKYLRLKQKLSYSASYTLTKKIRLTPSVYELPFEGNEYVPNYRKRVSTLLKDNRIIKVSR